MKFDPKSWQEAKTNEKIQAPKGWLRLRASAPCPLYIKGEGPEVLAGFGTSFDLQLAEAVTFRLDAPEGVRLFREVPGVTAVAGTGETFTNIDRMPDESGSIAEVTRAMRMFKIEQGQMLRQLRAESAALDAKKAKAAEVIEPDPEKQPEGEKPDPEAKP